MSRAESVVCGDSESNRGVDTGNLLDNQGELLRAESGAPKVLRYHDAEKAEVGHPTEDLRRKFL